jgi:hypothetical protein
MKFKVMRRKNKVYIIWKFDEEEIKTLLPLITNVKVKEVEYRNIITFEKEEEAKLMMKMKEVLKAIPSAILLSVPKDQITDYVMKVVELAFKLGMSSVGGE